jgi:hypothetical protein
MTDRSDLPEGARGPAGVPEAAVTAATRIAAGAAIMGLAGLSAIFNRGPDIPDHDDAESPAPSRMAAAMLASILETERRAADAIHAANARMKPVVDAARSNALFKPIESLRASSGGLADRGADDAERGAGQMLEALDALIGYVVREVLRHVEVNELVASIDVNALLARLDIQALIDRVDPNALVERLDVDAIARRIDVAELARRALEEIEVSNVIRESTGTLTVETVDALRHRGATADGRLARFVDSILRRSNGRDTRLDASDGLRSDAR